MDAAAGTVLDSSTTNNVRSCVDNHLHFRGEGRKGMTKNRLHFDSLDACLGPARTRFFGSGYQQVNQHLTKISAAGAAEPGAGAQGRAALTYPSDWSRKSPGRELRPHLSTIDALVLAVSLAEVHLTTAHRLTWEQRRYTWLRSADIRAGTRPHEDLSDFPVSAQLRSLADQPSGLPLRSVYDCRIGELRVFCTLEHAAGPGTVRPPSTSQFDTIADALGPSADRLYGDGYKRHTQHAAHVTVDLATERVRARQRLAAGAQTIQHGAEAAYAPSVSLVDCVLAIAQLAQTFLYSLDGIDRSSSNTLWMRRMVISADSPDRPFRGPFESVAYSAKNRLLHAQGRRWRAIDIATDNFCGIHGWCSLAHMLPLREAA